MDPVKGRTLAPNYYGLACGWLGVNDTCSDGHFTIINVTQETTLADVHHNYYYNQ